MGLSWVGEDDPTPKPTGTGFCEEHGVYHVSGEAHSCQAWEAWQKRQKRPALITLVDCQATPVAVWKEGTFPDWIANRLYDMRNDDSRYPYRMYIGGPNAANVYTVAPGNLATEIYLLLYANDLV